jgi:hypothetical protein
LTLELGKNANPLMRREARQLEQRSRADEVEHRGREQALAACHGRKEDEGRALAHGRLEALEGAHVLVVQIHVDEGRDLAGAVLEHLPTEAGIALREVCEELPDRRSGGLHLALAADLGTESGRDADTRHGVAWAAPPWQNST